MIVGEEVDLNKEVVNCINYGLFIIVLNWEIDWFKIMSCNLFKVVFQEFYEGLEQWFCMVYQESWIV